ncbi:Protein of unknown function DUF92 TMEM19 [Trinorchestia longiramus]|nr:Protein of unknown function DUF92 TMEM19 [Trinorchestia longiramus]
MQKTNTIKGVSKQQVLLLLVMSFLLPGMLLLFNSVLPFIGQVSVVRWLVVTLLPVVVATHGLYNKSLVMSGALTGIVLTQVLTLAHYGFLTQLFVFFVGGSRVTKFRQQRKQLLEEHFREVQLVAVCTGGERDGMQVLCTAGTAAVLSVLYLLQCGAGEHWLQLHSHCTHICLAVLGSFACAAGDTFSSEVGSVVGVTDPLLITTLRRVPRALHVSTARQHCTSALHVSTARQHYTSALHVSTTRQHCTSALL